MMGFWSAFVLLLVGEEGRIYKRKNVQELYSYFLYNNYMCLVSVGSSTAVAVITPTIIAVEIFF